MRDGFDLGLRGSGPLPDSSLVETGGAMVVGADNLSFESFPSEVEGNYIPVHTYLLAQQGVPILELVNLKSWPGIAFTNSLHRRRVEAPGADAAPIRPVALPLR